MNKYIIEGGINFFDELYKSLDDDDVEENNICLISNEPLTDNYFQMECGHKFNYIPLYYDIKNHKQKFNIFESNLTRLNTNEIRCPYCRNKQIGVLPYYTQLGLDKINGVNYINPNYKKYTNYPKYKYKTCEFVYNDVSNNSHTCLISGTQINYSHGTVHGENYGDEKYYCWKHKKIMIKKYKKDIADKLLEEVKKTKLEAKLKAKEEKLQEKLKAKEEKLQAKLKAKEAKGEKLQVNNENVVIQDNINQGCNNILKTGPKKGSLCGCKILLDNLCKRHYNLKHHKIVNDK